jgi:hypothetical protein
MGILEATFGSKVVDGFPDLLASQICLPGQLGGIVPEPRANWNLPTKNPISELPGL